ncbi:MAG: hypothetical protein HY040_05900 [Planctomycetes bacterium]|nr:hypothetical protein [Planctomycetota bacterium]
MPYRVVLRPSVAKAISQWGLSDFMLVEVYIRLREQLAADPTRLLMRLTEPFDGMVYGFHMIDPENRLCEHFFVFQVVFSQDEQTLIVAKAGYERREGL